MKLIALDTEATDVIPGQICQLSYLMADGEHVSGKNMFFQVNEMSESARQIHGMSLTDLKRLSGGARFSNRANEILADFEWADMLIGHNVAADMRYIRTEFERIGLALPARPTFCTMNRFTPITQLKRKWDPIHPKPPKLEELWTHYGLSIADIAAQSARWFHGGEKAHDARFDATATYMCLMTAVKSGDVEITP